MMYNLLMLTMSLNLSMLTIHSPMTMGVFTITAALILTITLNMLSSSWIAMATFLIYIGGLMVMFAYFLAIQPNQYLSSIAPLLSLVMSMSFTMMLMPMLTLTTPHYTFNSIHFMMSFPNHIITTLMMVLLFTMLIISVKVTSPYTGPMRPFT